MDEDLVAVTKDVVGTVAALPQTTMGRLSSGNVHTVDVVGQGCRGGEDLVAVEPATIVTFEQCRVVLMRDKVVVTDAAGEVPLGAAPVG